VGKLINGRKDVNQNLNPTIKLLSNLIIFVFPKLGYGSDYLEGGFLILIRHTMRPGDVK
jgi:hypothetical protein